MRRAIRAAEEARGQLGAIDAVAQQGVRGLEPRELGTVQVLRAHGHEAAAVRHPRCRGEDRQQRRVVTEQYLDAVHRLALESHVDAGQGVGRRHETGRRRRSSCCGSTLCQFSCTGARSAGQRGTVVQRGVRIDNGLQFVLAQSVACSGIGRLCAAVQGLGFDAGSQAFDRLLHRRRCSGLGLFLDGARQVLQLAGVHVDHGLQVLLERVQLDQARLL